MGTMDNLFGFFTGDNKKAENDVSAAAKDYVALQLSDAKIAQTLQIVDRVVDMQHWLFRPNESGDVPYENASLEDAVPAGEDVQELMDYMKGQVDYNGVELNDDVLKTVLTHFLNTIEVYEFDAHDYDLQEVVDQVARTPHELLKYVIEERQGKLDQWQQEVEDGAPLSSEFAKRIFEYDLLLQFQGTKAMGDSGRVNGYAKSYQRAAYREATRLCEVTKGTMDMSESAVSQANPPSVDLTEESSHGNDGYTRSAGEGTEWYEDANRRVPTDPFADDPTLHE